MMSEIDADSGALRYLPSLPATWPRRQSSSHTRRPQASSLSASHTSPYLVACLCLYLCLLGMLQYGFSGCLFHVALRNTLRSNRLHTCAGWPVEPSAEFSMNRPQTGGKLHTPSHSTQHPRVTPHSAPSSSRPLVQCLDAPVYHSRCRGCSLARMSGRCYATPPLRVWKIECLWKKKPNTPRQLRSCVSRI